MLNRLLVAISTVLTLSVGGLLLYMAIGRGVDAEGFALVPAVAGTLMIVGVFVASRSARIGTALVAAGAVAIVAMFPWMIAVTLPIAAVAIFGTLARGKGPQAEPA